MFVQRLGIDQAMLETASKKAQDGASAVTTAVSHVNITHIVAWPGSNLISVL